MTKKKLIVRVSSIEDSLAKFKNVWKRAQKGEQFKTPIEVLSFENPIILMKTLSPKRLELLQTLHVLGIVSIRQLSKKLKRDYSNVHQDIKTLYQIGIVLKNNGKYYVPWETIITEISLCPGKEQHKHSSAA